MGFHAISQPPAQDKPPSKNRVGVFRRSSPRRARFSAPQPVGNVRFTRQPPAIFSSGRPCWPSRDPIEEAGGSNLYAAGSNNLIKNVDILGLIRWRVWEGCCNGAAYNRMTKCCCCEGKAKRDGNEECRIVERRPIPTGVKQCYVHKSITGLYSHAFIVIDGVPVGFGPDQEKDLKDLRTMRPKPGIVRDPDEDYLKYIDDKSICEDVKLNSCEYNFEKFKQGIRDYITHTKKHPPHYIFPVATCIEWAENAIFAGMGKGGGCTLSE